MSKQQLSKGFTIVELVVVIAIIGILTAITTVTYNGVQQRALNSKMQTGMESWDKAIRIYLARNGTLPRTPGNAACLGYNYPATSQFPAGSCQYYGGGTGSTADMDSGINAAFKSQISALPDTSDIVTSFSGKFNFIARGIQYSYPTGATTAGLTYFIDGNWSCGNYSKFFYPTASANGVTLCTVNINVPS